MTYLISRRRAASRLGALVLIGLLLLCSLGGGAYWCFFGRHRPAPPKPPENLSVVQRERVEVPRVTFTDITDAAGIRFRHQSGAFGQKLLPETMGSGVAFLDYDNDGRQDLLFVNSCPWPGHAPSGQPLPTLALYHNEGGGKFSDVTAAAGLAVPMYGMGVTCGDYDNDGFIDVFITGVGGNRLFHNVADGQGGRTFVDVTAAAGVGGPGGWPVSAAAGDFLKQKEFLNWSSSAAFLDCDGDGKLDLFVCNYVTWSPESDLAQPYTLKGGGVDRAYGPPLAFPGSHCLLYRNKGDGRFEDVSAASGVQVSDIEGAAESARKRAIGKSLGVAVCDFDDDGRPDVIVANDTVRNFFFRNNGDGTFTEMGLATGVAYAEGKARGAMGVDTGEYRPGKWACVIGNFADEPDTFLRLDNPRRLTFSDVALAEGLAGPSRPLLKFGAFFFDYDLDGRLDLLTCNGHLEPEIGTVQAGQRYAQPPQLFWNTGGKQRFEPATAARAGEALFAPLVGRGSAYADIDGDGDLDVVLVGNGGPARLLRNDGGTGHHWVRLNLHGDGVHSNRSALGARVTLEAGGQTQVREVSGPRGYLSQSELPVTFGLGTVDKIDKVTIRWPGKEARTQVLTDLAVDREHIIRQGK